jgi:hypothetical protein
MRSRHSRPRVPRIVPRKLYLDTQVTGIRRQVDNHKDAVCLANLLRDIAAKPDVMSRERFRALYDEPDELGADKTYDKYFGPGSATTTTSASPVPPATWSAPTFSRGCEHDMDSVGPMPSASAARP